LCSEVGVDGDERIVTDWARFPLSVNETSFVSTYKHKMKKGGSLDPRKVFSEGIVKGFE